MEKKDLEKFSELVNLMDSRRQMNRIDGRIQWAEFSKRFTKEELDAAWKEIKDWQ